MGIESGPHFAGQEDLEAPQTEVDREEQARRLTSFLDRVHAEQVFDSKEHKQEFVKNLTYEDYADLLLRINGIVRDIPQQERQLFQPVHMAVPEGVGALILSPSDMPAIKDKPALLEKGFNRAKELEDPRDIGLLAAATINAVHVFEDGNGRTSRLVYDLLNYNYSGSEANKKFLQAALSEDGRSMTPDVDPTYLLDAASRSLLVKEGFDKFNGGDYYFFRDRPKTFNDREDLSDEQKKKFNFLIEKSDNDQHAVLLAISRILSKDDRLKDFVSYFVKPEEGINRAPLDGEKLAAGVTGEDIEKFYEGYWQAKGEVVSELIDMVAEDREMPNLPWCEGKTARQFQREEIARDLERNREQWEDLRENWPEYPEETT